MEPLNIKQLLIGLTAHALAAILNYGSTDLNEGGLGQQAVFEALLSAFYEGEKPE
jgi:hypothetical protein